MEDVADGDIAWWVVVMSIREQSTALRETANGLPALALMYVYHHRPLPPEDRGSVDGVHGFDAETMGPC